MSKIADILSQLHAVAQDGSKSERRMAALVLAEPDYISKAAISEIAQRAGVSEPTVTRFCRALGCDGVRDFKFFLAQALAIGGQYLSAEAPSRDVREARIALAITDGAISAIQRASDNLDMSVIMNIAGRIAVSGSVLCIGSGGISSMMATEMQNRLFRLGIPVVAQIDGQLQRMYAAIAESKTMVIAFSVSGYARSVIEAAEVAKQYGAETVAITAPGSDLAGTVNTVIPFLVNEDGNLYKPTSSRFALLAIVDMIATATAEMRGTEVLERLRRIKQSLNMLKVDDPSLPLGD
ncbi:MULTISPECIES: MurR/RpiR family transcriptional regulator [Ochrobactrum]|uniref:MurR/RpiR family transcriptional regulator n=1 Tax=Ochrobactrum chromiisoli TaxID=2993941 RepID=A0ABT3QMN0_9HYPH|nr:MurR/RpiR family transcriptional regulator [Ochrobactrum chromiisoli]MCX2696874.1 MurR/RpiR family transcriptional regulator [Ochrobactrum chromiisoli]